jgi:hypothetical protein
MTDLLGTEPLPDDGNDVMAGHARGFVDQENTVKSVG